MEKGTVKWFHRKKGYWFIVNDTGEDVFVHHTTIDGTGFKYLDDGEVVEFDMEQSDKGLKATAVVRQK